MKYIILILGFLFSINAYGSSYFSNQSGDSLLKTGGSSWKDSIGYWNHPDGSSSQEMGDTMWHSDGSSSWKDSIGYWNHPDGSSSQEMGDTMWHSDGSSSWKDSIGYWNHPDGSSSQEMGDTMWH